MEGTARDMWVDGIMSKVGKGIAVSETGNMWNDCICFIDVLRWWLCIWSGNIYPTHLVKQKACKSALQATSTGNAKWEAVRLPESMQCSLEAGVLEGTSLCNSPCGENIVPLPRPYRHLPGRAFVLLDKRNVICGVFTPMPSQLWIEASAVTEGQNVWNLKHPRCLGWHQWNTLVGMVVPRSIP